MNEFFNVSKIKESIKELLKCDINQHYAQIICSIYKSQIDHLFNYPNIVKEYFFRQYIPKSPKEYFEKEIKKKENWFVKAFGIFEQDYDTTKRLFTFIKSDIPIRGKGNSNTLIAPNGNKYEVGEFTTPTLSELRKIAIKKIIIKPYVDMVYTKGEPLIVIEDLIVEDILSKHIEFPNSTIQAASQFNALEFQRPSLTPRAGITEYYSDLTQGPSCALACAAGTFVRNYYCQTSEKQINYLDEFEKAIENEKNKYFEITNGYIIFIGSKEEQQAKLEKLNDYLTKLETLEYNKLKDLIKIGLHQNVEIIFKNRFELVDEKGKTVNQVYAAALSIGYNREIQDDPNWEKFATLVLEAQYEATLLSAINGKQDDSYNDVILTFVGGGVFGNKKKWIFNAIVTAIKEVKKIRNSNFQIKLNIKIGHFQFTPEPENSIDKIINKKELDLELKN